PDSLDGSGCDGHAAGSKATVQQRLNHKSSDAVSDEDWRLVEAEQKALVMIHDLANAKPRVDFRCTTQRADVALHPGPARRMHTVSALGVVMRPELEAERGH